MAAACEEMRLALVTKWLGDDDGQAQWKPKCDLVLHSSDEAYVREVGSGGRMTVASSLIDQKQGRISLRRIDIRANQPDWQHRALGHELTHVVLADRFEGRAVPRWVDEGIAISTDPAEKQGQHLRDLKHAIASRSEFRLIELFSLADYPPADRWGAFYGQSASLVQFLVAQGGPERFLKFIEQSFDTGLEPSLQGAYGFGVADLERRWQSHLKSPVAVDSRAVPAQAVSLKKTSAGSVSHGR